MRDTAEALPLPPAIDIHALVSGHSIQPWLLEECISLSTGDLLQRLASIGLLIRMWMPQNADERKTVIEDLLSRNSMPAVESRCQELIAQFSSNEISSIEDLSVEYARLLLLQLDLMLDAVVAEDPDAGSLGLNILLSRDNLTAIYAVLATRGAGHELKTVLDDFDSTALSALMAFREAEVPFHERLWAAAVEGDILSAAVTPLP